MAAACLRSRRNPPSPHNPPQRPGFWGRGASHPHQRGGGGGRGGGRGGDFGARARARARPLVRVRERVLVLPSLALSRVGGGRRRGGGVSRRLSLELRVRGCVRPCGGVRSSVLGGAFARVGGCVRPCCVVRSPVWGGAFVRVGGCVLGVGGGRGPAPVVGAARHDVAQARQHPGRPAAAKGPNHLFIHPPKKVLNRFSCPHLFTVRRRPGSIPGVLPPPKAPNKLQIFIHLSP